MSVGVVVKTTRTTPVFAKPAAKSKVLADAETGTLLTLKRVSPQGTWLLLSDDEGNEGWVPANRTDYTGGTKPLALNAPPPSAPAPNVAPTENFANEADGRQEGDDAELARAKARHGRGLLSEIRLNGVRADHVGFASVSFTRWKPMFLDSRTAFRSSGVELDAMSDTDGERVSAALRLAVRSSSVSGRWEWGPDLGLRYVIRGDNGFGLEGGYTLAVRLAGAWGLSVRAGFEKRDGWRWTGSGGLGLLW